MNHLTVRFLPIIFLFVCKSLFAQKKKLSEFYLIQRQYESRAENDSTALPLVQKLIRMAKVKENHMQLYMGYTDARYYSPDPELKIMYADSAIAVAMKMKNDSLLSSAYLSKGVVYYFYLKKYKLALNEYLKAFEKNKSRKDYYYRNKINYHIGVVKSYIGYHADALSDFEESRQFFENETKKDLHPNLMYGNQRGYNNTLHQMAVCYRNLHNFKKSDSLVVLGLENTWKNSDYKQEHSYFLKEEGISRYRKGDFGGAIQSLQNSLQNLIRIKDFSWLTASYAYLGKAQWRLGYAEEGIRNFDKIDSIFNKHSFVLPEVRDVYENLIVYYKDKNDASKALYYTTQLIKVDKVLEKDFIYLSSKIHKDYDTKRLLQEKAQLERQISIRRWVLITAIFLVAFIPFYLLLRIRSRKMGIGKNNLLSSSPVPIQEGTFRIRHYSRTKIGQDVVNEILSKLTEFELNEEFLKPKTDLKSVAKKFEVNSNYLSNVINEHRGASFNRYLSELRINYITKKLLTDPLYLKYDSTTLAKECGIASRTNFSSLFKEINGISFSDFIRNNKYENGMNIDP